MAAYEIALIVAAVALLGTVVLPRLLENRPLSFPILYVALGFLIVAVVPSVPAIDPVADTHVTERLTEMVVIISLMGAGLKLDRPFSLRGWTATWRLLAIALSFTAAAMAVLAWGLLGALPATAIPLGAVIAPTAAGGWSTGCSSTWATRSARASCWGT